jgi:16S rRNA (adenine1518-N6/adenine1519-N6)-dimethyltransferase
MPSPRQTISFLRARFREAGIRPDTRHGQNFLIDLNLLDLLVQSAGLQSTDVVLEVGTGTGSLTARLASLAGAVVTVELDARLAQLASEQLGEYGNVTLLQRDVLRGKNRLDPAVMQAVAGRRRELGDTDWKLVANLPYSIATPLISNLLGLPCPPTLMVVTIQRELADRIVAVPSTKDYSSLSVWVQSLTDPELVRLLPPSVFWPRPQVHSAIIRLPANRAKRAAIPDLGYFHRFVRTLFLHRRKVLRRALASAYRRQLSKGQVDQLLSAAGLPGEVRAEELTVATIQQLCETFRQHVQASAGNDAEGQP